MKKPLLFKLLTIGILMLLLLIPLGLIGNSIYERQRYSESVVQDIAKSSSYSQTITGPVLVIPYIKTERIAFLNDKKERVLEEKEVKGKLYFLPEILRMNTNMNTELRKRGIYRAHLYHAKNMLDGNFVVPDQFGLGNAIRNYQLQPAYIALGISDIRGIENSLSLQWNQTTLNAAPGTQLTALGNGVHVKLGMVDAGQHYNFSLGLQLQGTGTFNFAPLGKETHFSLNSDWPHPSFIGEYLPVERSITKQGFSARWQTSFFSTNMAELFENCAYKYECTDFAKSELGVNLIDPINQTR